MGELTTINYDPGVGLEENFSRVESQFGPAVTSELEQARQHMTSASRLDQSRRENLQKIIEEALLADAAKLQERSERVASLSNNTEYSSAVEIVRWYEDIYLPKQESQPDPQPAQETQRKLYEEKKEKLREAREKEVDKPLDMGLIIYGSIDDLRVGVPFYTIQSEDESVTGRLYRILKDRLSNLGKLNEEANGRLKCLAFSDEKVKPGWVYEAVVDLSEKDEVRKLNLKLRVYDATKNLEHRTSLGYEEKGPQLPTVTPDSEFSLGEAANYLGLTDRAVRNRHYQSKLAVENPRYDPKARIGTPESRKFVVTGRKFYDFVRANSLSARCRFEGFESSGGSS